MRKNNTEPLKDVISRYLKAVGGDKKVKEIQLKQKWEELMGRNIAEQTEYININKGVFYIKLRSSVVKHELSLMKTVILDRLNSEAEEKLISEIVFV